MNKVLRNARLKKKLTLNDVASRLGVTGVSVSRYERGDRKLPVPMAKKLGNLYGVGWERFYEEETPDGKTDYH